MLIYNTECLITLTPYHISDMCTGNYREADPANSGNGKQRPSEGTRCVSACKMESGRWGSSYCYTNEDNTQWGAECIPCSGINANNV